MGGGTDRYDRYGQETSRTNMGDIIQAGIDRQKGRIGNCATGAGMPRTTNM